MACAAIGIKVRKEDVSAVQSTPNSVLLALLGLLREKGLLEFPLSHWPWRSHLKATGVYGEGWLPFYEAVRRKWTTDKVMVSAVASDPILSAMLKANVTFLEDYIFEATKINLAKRTFKKGQAKQAIPKFGWANISEFVTDYD